MKPVARLHLGLAATLALAVPVSVAAQTDCPMHAEHTASPAASATPETQAHHDHAMSPYAGTEGSEIKALSSDELKAYREGTGMGLAKPAELNHYPGPRHVLDMSNELGLTSPQTADLKAIFDRMHVAAVSLGEQIITKEKALDQAFASGLIDVEKLRGLTAEIATLQAELRAAHLKAHVETKRVLTAQQVMRYDSLRGYGTPARS